MKLLFLSSLLLLLFSCESSKKPQFISPENKLWTVPPGFPEVEYPEDNQFTMNRWELGRELFYEKLLSRDSSISCASCHLQNQSFSENREVSRGVDGREGSRNASSLVNVAYQPYFTREGGVKTLEMQVLVPIQEHNEFDYNIVEIANRLKNYNNYNEKSLKAYERELDPFVITRSIACYERTLISGNSEYDKFENSGNAAAFGEKQKMGYDLFFSERTNCSSCHSGFNFTNYAFENNGLYEVYQDVGRFRVTNIEQDKHLFKVPTLRNIEFTWPYMHDGSIHSLEDVVEHYNSGGKNNSQQSHLIQPLNLTDKEKEALVAFLKSLSDYEFIHNELFQNPHKR